LKVSLEILKPGLMTSIQDLGRLGLNFYAMANSGAMDEHAAKIANLLLRKKEDEPVIECTIMAPSILFNSPTEIAITGADFTWKINDNRVATNQKLTIKKGDVLSGGTSKNGMRAYIAVQGQLELVPTFGSYATQLNARIGGFEGRQLKKGDVIEWSLERDKNSNRIAVFKGPEYSWLSKAAQETFVGEEYLISSESNRMGIRLKGKVLDVSGKVLPSSVPLLPGFIQLPPNGMPIIVLQDGQTTGGYPRIAYIRREELSRLNQLKIGSGIRFQKMN
jgi:antagonist of KipI